MPKKLYIVRHGETAQNREKKFQSEDIPLSEEGFAQAHDVAKRFEKISLDVVYTSPMVRAHQTAQAIADVVRLPVNSISSLGELTRPTSLMGKGLFEPEGMEFKRLAWEHRHDVSWHFEDEANIQEFIVRHRIFKKFVEKDSHERILAVTHGLVMKSLVGVFIFPHLDPSDFYMDAYSSLYISNTGITEFEQKDDGTWVLVTWNDQQHLG